MTTKGREFLCFGNSIHPIVWIIRSIFVSSCRSVPPHSLRRLPDFPRYSLGGSFLPAPPAGRSQASSDHRSQPCSHAGLLPPSATSLHEHEHELHCLLPQVSRRQLHERAKPIWHPNVWGFFWCRSPALQFLLPRLGTLRPPQALSQRQWRPPPTPVQHPPCYRSRERWWGCRGSPTTPGSKTSSASSRDTRSVQGALNHLGGGGLKLSTASCSRAHRFTGCFVDFWK